jgi:hypothetical protein
LSALLTLDLATRIGWTRGPATDRAFESGSYRLPSTGDDLGLFLASFRQWLERVLPGVHTCVFEAPILPRQTMLSTARKLYSQAAFLELACLDQRVRCLEANNSTIKSFMGVAGCKGKEPMMAAVRAYGYDFEDHDQADAIALRLFAVHKLFPDTRGEFNTDLGPLGAATRSAASV